MKWFKHDAHSLRKANIERLIMEYGIEGYGLYYACLEMIAGDIATDDLTFELKHDAELIAHKFKMDTMRVEKIMHRCIELNLFDLADSGRIRCLKLAHMLEESISKNREMRLMKENLYKSGLLHSRDSITAETPESVRTLSGVKPDNSGIIPTRREEKRKEERRGDESKIISPFFEEFWNIYDKKIDRVKCIKLWESISNEKYGVILKHSAEYVNATPDKKFRKNPETYLRNECWNNEIIRGIKTSDNQSIDENFRRFEEIFNEIQ